MANAKSISPEEFKQIEMILMDIASKASTLKDLSSDTQQHCGRGHAATLVAAMVPISSQIGYMADVVLKRLSDGPGFSEGAEYWFLAPTSREGNLQE
jgi:hypothetical protein